MPSTSSFSELFPGRQTSARQALYFGLFLLGICGLYHALCWVFPTVFHAIGGVHMQQPFMDLYVLFAASDTHALGIEVYQPLALDPYGRPHMYSTWWLGFSFLGLNRANTHSIALVIISVFALFLVAQLRPYRFSQLAYYASLLCSFPFVLVVERANADMLVYVLLLSACFYLRTPRSPWCIVGFLILFFAAGLKYYPLVGLLLVLEAQDRRSFLLRSLFLSCVGVLWVVLLWDDVRRSVPLFQIPYGILGIGSGSVAQVLRVEGFWADVARLLPAVLVFVFTWLHTPVHSGQPKPLDTQERWFILGAIVLCASFWLTINHSYRWIFVALLAPHLWRQLEAGDRLSVSERTRARLLSRLLVAVPWLISLSCALLVLRAGSMSLVETFELSDRLCLILQLPIWVFFLLLVACLARFAKPRLLWLLWPSAAGTKSPVD